MTRGWLISEMTSFGAFIFRFKGYQLELKVIYYDCIELCKLVEVGLAKVDSDLNAIFTELIGLFAPTALRRQKRECPSHVEIVLYISSSFTFFR